jgi:hypothetical protein
LLYYIYSVVTAALPSPQKMKAFLLTVNITLDLTNPPFGIARRNDSSHTAPVVEWAVNDCGLEAGDR